MKYPYPIYKPTGLGLTNFNYITSSNLLVRFSNDYCDAFLDRENEIKVLKLIQAGSFQETLPIIEYGYCDQHFYIASKFESELYTLERIGISRAYLSRISQLLKRFHKIDYSNADIKRFDAWKFLEWFIDQLTSINKMPSNLEQPISLLKQQILTMQGQELALCHNDLVKGNFAILYNHLYLIDFEYAMINDFVFDIASFISESLTKEDDIQAFIEECALNQTQIARLGTWITYQDLLWSLWATYLFAKTKDAQYQKISEAKLLRFLNSTI